MSSTDANGNETISDPGEIAAFFARLIKREDERLRKKEISPEMRAWRKRIEAVSYGKTKSDALLNWRLYYDVLMAKGAFEHSPGQQVATVENNPVTWLATGPGAIAKEAQVINEARGIFKEINILVDAFKAGTGVEVKIGGRTILVEPQAPISGMTLFSEKAFVLGKEAFSTGEELAKTILHELYRLANSAGGATSGAKAAKETKAAASFAERAIKKL